jgi:hypothetical protein
MVMISLPAYSKLNTDQMIITEEHQASIIVPSGSIPTQSSNIGRLQRDKAFSLIKEVLSDQLESIVQADFGIGDGDSLDSPSISVDLCVKEGHGEKKGTGPDTTSTS